MAVRPLLVQLLLELTTVSGNVREAYTTETCDEGKSLASEFLHSPDAWKLVNHTRNLFCLVYHSANKTIRHLMPCLCARLSSTEEGRHKAKYLYQYSNETMTLTGLKQVEINRTDKAFKHKNEFVVTNYVDGNTVKEQFRLLYTDYKSCVVLNSTSLGAQVWVERHHLVKLREVPYACAVVYELAAGDVRNMVFNWKECPERQSFKRHTAAPAANS